MIDLRRYPNWTLAVSPPLRICPPVVRSLFGSAKDVLLFRITGPNSEGVFFVLVDVCRVI